MIANGESTELDLSNSTSGIQRLPEAALGSGKVESLCLANSVGDITTESFHQKLTMLGQRDLRRIDLEGNRLQDVHESVLSMPKLETLILRDNALRTLTPEIARLNMLTELDVRKNFLAELPEAIGELRLLRLLNANRNILRELPDSLGQLECLTTLWLSHNRLGALPDACAKLPLLDDLNLHDNRLAQMPSVVAGAPKLTWLSVGRNKLQQLPASTFASDTLRILHVQHNAITDLPPLGPAELAACKLRVLWLSGNPIAPQPNTEPKPATIDLLAALPELTELRLRASKRDGMPERSNSVDDLLDQKRSQKSIGASPEPNRALGSPSANRAAGSDGEKSPQRTSVAKRRVSFSDQSLPKEAADKLHVLVPSC